MKNHPESSETHGLAPEEAQILLRRVLELSTLALGNDSTARDAITNLGLTIPLIEGVGAGYCAGGLRKILNDPSLAAKLRLLGVLDAKQRERFKGCFVFPIFTVEGAIAGLWGVPLDGGEYRYLHGQAASLWNIAAARLASQLLVVASPLDALALKAAGFNNVVAVTPGCGPVETRLLEKHGVQHLSVVVGSESAVSADDTAAQLKPYRSSVITLPDCAGALAHLKAHGDKSLAERVVAGMHGVVATNVPGMRPRPDGFALQVRDIDYVVINPERTRHKLRATVRASRCEKTTAMTLDFHQLRQRHEFVREMARVFGESADRIEADLRKLQEASDVRLAQPEFMIPGEPQPSLPEGARKQAEAMGKDPDLFGLVLRDFDTCGIVGEKDNILLSFLTVTSRRMDTPLALMVLSSMGAGKSKVAELARDLCPREDRVDSSYISGKSLYHLPSDGVKHKLLTIAEAEGAKQALYPLRVLISSGELSAVVTGRDAVSGKLQTETKRVEGPTAFIVTSSDPSVDRETLSRFIVTSADESKEQTAAIQERQRAAQSAESIAGAAEVQRITRRHHDFQRLIEPRRVIVPPTLKIDYTDDRLCSRRDFPKVLGLIKAIAFARQMAKETKIIEGVACIEADERDVALATPLIRRLFGNTLDELSAPSRTLLRLLYDFRVAAKNEPHVALFNGEGQFVFTRRQIAERLRWSKTSLHRCMKELEDSEYVVRDMSSRRRPFRYVLDWAPPKNSSHVPPKFHSDGPESKAAS